jgi:hypothetical protein
MFLTKLDKIRTEEATDTIASEVGIGIIQKLGSFLKPLHVNGRLFQQPSFFVFQKKIGPGR